MKKYGFKRFLLFLLCFIIQFFALLFKGQTNILSFLNMRNDTLHKKEYLHLYKIFGFLWLFPGFSDKKLAKDTKICSQIWQVSR